MEKITKTLKKDWIVILLILASFILSLYFYPSLPDKVPNHWNINGEVDGYTNRFWGAFGIPFLNAGLYILFIVLPHIDPKRKNYDRFPSTYRYIRYLMHIFFIGLQVFTFMAALGSPVKINAIVPIGIGLLFIFFGNVLGRVKHNYFVGIRTPWTLASEEVWRKTHRLAGPMWVAGGILGIIASLINSSIGGKLFFGILMVISLVPTVYSYFVYRNLNQ